MGKNNQLINLVRDTAKFYSADRHVINMMCAFAIALKENTNLEQEDIAELLAETQAVWDRYSKFDDSLVKACEEITNINVLRRW